MASSRLPNRPVGMEAHLIRCRDCDHDLRGGSARVCGECGRAFDPADRRSYATTRRSFRQIILVRMVLGFVLVPAAFGVGYSRSQEFWPSLDGLVRHFLLVLVLFGPWILLLGFVVQRLRPAPHPIRRAASTAAWCAAAAVAAAEVWCLPQEIGFWHRTRHLAATAPPIFEQRWNPFSDHHVAYSPSTGEWFGGD